MGSRLSGIEKILVANTQLGNWKAEGEHPSGAFYVERTILPAQGTEERSLLIVHRAPLVIPYDQVTSVRNTS